MFKQFAAAALAISISTGAFAGEFNSAQLLTQPKDNQIGYINASVAMASVMVSDAQSQCIRDWTKKNHSDGYASVLSTMKRHSSYHPAAVIAAVIEKACGSFEIASH